MLESMLSSQNPLSAKLSQVLGTSYTDYAVRSALESLDAQFTENTPTSRRQLRATLERQDIQSSGKLLEQYERVIDSLNNLKSSVADIQNTCKTMHAHTVAASLQISRSLADAELLQSRRDQIGTKHTILSAFQKTFTLPEEQINHLTSAEPVDEKFFEVFDAVKRIHSNCQSLLTTDNNRAGIEIMEQMNRYLDLGFQKLFRWTQKLFKSLQRNSPDIDPITRRAIRTLAERPTLFQKCLDSFSEMRKKVVLQDFMEALTQGENALSARAINVQAHDPLRYLGDILAWTHQAVASEKEILALIFGVAANSRLSKFEPGNERWLEDGTILSAIEDLIERDLEATCRPIRSRIEHLITSQEDPTLIFRIGMLLKFYRHTLDRMLNESATLITIITTLEKYSMRQFYLLMAEKAHSIVSALDEDLGPPVFFLDAISDLRIILSSYDSSMAPIAEDNEEMFAILDSALTPYLRQCERIAESLPELSQYIMLSNCYDLAKLTLKLFSLGKKELDGLNDKLQAVQGKIVVDQHRFFVNSSGIRPFLDILTNETQKTALSRHPQFSIENLEKLSQALEEFLPNALMDAQSRLKKLTSPRLANILTHDAASLFVEDFILVEGAIRNHVELSQTVFPRSGEEVRLLLGF